MKSKLFQHVCFFFLVGGVCAGCSLLPLSLRQALVGAQSSLL